MSDFKLEFHNTLPRGAQAEIKALLKPYTYLLEREIRILRVGMKGARSTDDGQACTMTARPYLWATVELDPEFFTLEPDEKERVVAHEVTHVLHDIYAREVFQIVMHFVPENLHGYVLETLEDAEERVIETISSALYMALKEH